MSHLAKRKSRLTFQTCDTVRERGRLREVIIEADPYTARVRLAGMRTSYPVSYAAIYNQAVLRAVEAERAAKKAARKAKGK